ncbi:MAG: family 10 glycosylhydrolase [Clostridia bacterium]|nr:family 10 glycosylhydrolase [Clostridia bacterium]
MKRRFLAVMAAFCLLFVVGCHTAKVPESSDSSHNAAGSTDVLQGVWVSYLELDELLTDATPENAATRLDEMMDTCRRLGLDTLFFHVRAHGDAYYASSVYPAADAAAGLLEQGFDPLAYAVEAAHRQGLAIHAWVNPYRLGDTAHGDSFQKDGVWYADPGSPTARGRVLEGVRELLAGYPVEGIHFDDYFYPAGMAAEGESFETIPTGTDVTLWRQTQVDALVSSVYNLCKQAGRTFGISPMASIEQCRTVAFADVERWMSQPGYVDYICPQLYTGFDHQTNPFPKMLRKWAALPRREEVNLYVGLALYKAGLENDPYAGSGSGEWATHDDILARQVAALRKKADGFVLFRHGFLTDPVAKNELENLQTVL